jgi:hypothetical protein
MRHWLTLILLPLIAPAAFAGPEVFEGTWNGKGTYILEGDLTQCSELELTFSANATTFTFVSGRRVCDKHSEQFYPVTMQYRNGELFFNGQLVGNYDGNTLNAYYSMPDGDSVRHWRMFMRREVNHLMYEESRTMEGETTPMISFSGLGIKK